MRMTKQQVDKIMCMMDQACRATWGESPVPSEGSWTRGVWEREIQSRSRYGTRAWAQAIESMVATATAGSKCPKLGDLTTAVEGLVENPQVSAAQRAEIRRELSAPFEESMAAVEAAYRKLMESRAGRD